MRDLTILWMKGGAPLERWTEGKDYFMMNAIKITQQMVKMYGKQGGIQYVAEKVQPYASEYYQAA